MAFAMAAEIERDLISSRTREALRAKKVAGVPLGRPRGPGKSKLDPYRVEIEALLANGSTQKFIAGRYGTSEANLSNWMKKHGLRRAAGRFAYISGGEKRDRGLGRAKGAGCRLNWRRTRRR